MPLHHKRRMQKSLCLSLSVSKSLAVSGRISDESRRWMLGLSDVFLYHYGRDLIARAKM